MTYKYKNLQKCISVENSFHTKKQSKTDEKGKHVNQRDNGNNQQTCRSPLLPVASLERQDTEKWSSKESFNNYIYDEEGTSPLFIACQNGRDTNVQHLLKNGANINLCNKKGLSPLYIASKSGHASTVQILLNQDGVDVNSCSRNGASPLYVACHKGCSIT